MDIQEQHDKLDEAAAVLMEYFDCVQIHASFMTQDGGTAGMHRGRGNWFARQGLAQDFINTDANQDLAREISSVMPPADQDGDDWKD